MTFFSHAEFNIDAIYKYIHSGNVWNLKKNLYIQIYFYAPSNKSIFMIDLFWIIWRDYTRDIDDQLSNIFLYTGKAWVYPYSQTGEFYRKVFPGVKNGVY